MEGKYVQGAYNKGDHDFIERSNEQLQDRMNELHENNRQIGYTGERLAQVQREMTLIAMEMAERLRTSRGEEIEAAWRSHEGKTVQL